MLAALREIRWRQSVDAKEHLYEDYDLYWFQLPPERIPPDC